MKSARKHIACLLILALPWSAWSNSSAPCMEKADTAEAPETTVVDVHVHHPARGNSASGERASGSMDHAAHHTSAEFSDRSIPTECPCCEDCEAMCVLATYSPVALATRSDDTAPTQSDTLLAQTDAFRVGPPLRVLYRPPIFVV